MARPDEIAPSLPPAPRARGAPGCARETAGAGEARAPGPRGAVADDDAHLMARVGRGDDAAFEALYRRYRLPVIAFVRRFTRRTETAEELAQDIFIKCYRAARTYEPRAAFSTWLFGIARNHCLNELRRQEHRHPAAPIEAADGLASGESPEAAARAAELTGRIEAALATLPESQRTALVLSRFAFMSYAEVAAAMGTSVSAVRSLLNRARTNLVARLGDDLT